MVVSVRKLAQLSKEEQMYKMEPFVSRLQNMLSPCISSFKPVGVFDSNDSFSFVMSELF